MSRISHSSIICWIIISQLIFFPLFPPSFPTLPILDLPLMVMTSTPWMSSNGSPSSRSCTRSSTTMTWTARRDWSVRLWGSQSTTETLPRSSRVDSSKMFLSFLCCIILLKHSSYFRYAKYLEVLSLPDDMRELLDEYLDANSRAEQQKDCSEFFQCPYSIKESMKKNTDGNSL